jgi:hypothetical protein
MPIDDLTARVQSLVQEYQATRDRDTVLGAEADREAAALWKVVRAVDPDTASPWLDEQLAKANAALGWLHYWRHRESTGARKHAELARALLCLKPASDEGDIVPEELKPVAGRVPDPNQAIQDLHVGEVLIVLNPVVYARRIEYGFTGVDSLGRYYNQGGHHMVGQTMAEMPAIADAAIARVGGA